jgi:hypothetical protein
LPEPHLKAILRACYEEIDIAWTRFQQGQAIVALPTLPPPVLRGEGLARWLWRIHRINNGIVPLCPSRSAAAPDGPSCG